MVVLELVLVVRFFFFRYLLEFYLLAVSTIPPEQFEYFRIQIQVCFLYDP
jgi:hypothetical protein